MLAGRERFAAGLTESASRRTSSPFYIVFFDRERKNAFQGKACSLMATPTVPFDPKLVSVNRGVLSVAEARVEWNPSSVEVFADEPLQPDSKASGLVGGLHRGRNLKKVIKRYIDKGGASALT